MRDSEVFVSCFEFEFLFRICRRIFDSNFEFKFLEFSCRILKSNFEFEFFVSLLYSISRISIFDSNFDSSFECKFLEFDDSKLSSKFSMSCSIRLLEIDRQIRLLEVRCSIRLLEFRVFDSNFRCKRLDFSSSNLSSNFEFVLISSTSRISIRNFDDYQVLEIVVEIVVFVSHSSFEFLIELFNFRRNSAICIAILN